MNTILVLTMAAGNSGYQVSSCDGDSDDNDGVIRVLSHLSPQYATLIACRCWSFGLTPCGLIGNN